MTRARRLTAALLVTALSQTAVLPAFAQQADDATTVAARARFKEGVDAFDKGRYEEARLAFLQAYTLRKHPAVLLNLAQSSAKANRPLEAAKYFNQFLKEATTATPQQKRDAENGLAEVRQKIGRISVVAPAGTEVTIDDQKVGTTPLDVIDVEPGQHVVKGGGQSVTVNAMVGQQAEAKLTPAETSATPTPTPTPTAQPTAEEPPKQPIEPPKEEKRSSGPDPMWPVYAGIGVGVVGLAGTILFAAFKSSAQSKADNVAADIRNKAVNQYGVPAQGACNNPAIQVPFATACQTLRDDNSKVNTDAMVANVSIGVMIVGFVGAGAYYLLGPRKESKSAWIQKPVLTPWANTQSGGLTFSADLF